VVVAVAAGTAQGLVHRVGLVAVAPYETLRPQVEQVAQEHQVKASAVLLVSTLRMILPVAVAVLARLATRMGVVRVVMVHPTPLPGLQSHTLVVVPVVVRHRAPFRVGMEAVGRLFDVLPGFLEQTI
jgi:hypothetical protein